MLKPFTFSRFLVAVEKFNKNGFRPELTAPRTPPKDYLFIKSGNKSKMVKIVFNDINYVAGASNYVTFYLKGEEYLTHITMAEVIEVLKGHSFFRIHKSYTGNIDKIKIIENGSVVLVDKSIIPISNTYKEALFKQIAPDALQ